MRLFLAIDLNDAVRDAIAAEQRRIATSIGDADRSSLKWVRPAHMHLTLVFLGEVAQGAVPRIIDAVSPHLDVAPFTMVFERLGVFPPHGAPRVLWLGVGEGVREVEDVERRMTERLERVDISREGRPFHPHLTLARWPTPHPRAGARVLQCDRHAAVARLPVDGVTLYESRLSSAGPTYTALARATLT